MQNEKNKIKLRYITYLNEITVKSLTVKLILAVLILFFYVYSDLAIRHNFQAFYTRFLPIGIGLPLLVFHLLTKQKYQFKKVIFWNIFVVSLFIMVYANYLVYVYQKTEYISAIGIILVIFLISLELKTKLALTIVIYFGTFLAFLSILVLYFPISGNDYTNFANIVPLLILGFVINCIQNRLRYNSFKANYLLSAEKQKTEELYQKTITINKNLNQKNEEIKSQRDTLEEQQLLLTDNINYAKRIQGAMLPTFDLFENNFADYFIIYKPRDIVSGDFYWIEKYNDDLICVIADCTGHGVSGAMVSMLGISLLNKITTSNNKLSASEMLDLLRLEIKKSLKQKEMSITSTNDGMDISLCIIDTKTKKMQFAGAYNSLYIYRNNNLIELKADRQPVSIHILEKEFTNHEFQLQKDDILYSFSDGFVDQFNEKNKKYKSKRFKELLLKHANEDMKEQKNIILNEFYAWKLSKEQIDDIVIAGLKI